MNAPTTIREYLSRWSGKSRLTSIAQSLFFFFFFSCLAFLLFPRCALAVFLIRSRRKRFFGETARKRRYAARKVRELESIRLTATEILSFSFRLVRKWMHTTGRNGHVPTERLPKSGLRQPHPNQGRLLPGLSRYVYRSSNSVAEIKLVHLNFLKNGIYNHWVLDQSNRSSWQGGRDGQFARHYPTAAGRNQQQVGGLHLRRAVRINLLTLLPHSVTLFFCLRQLRRNILAITTDW